MAYTVYVLESASTGRLYIGQTQHLARRLREHASGQTASTRGRGPWRLLHTCVFDTRGEAIACERMLKALKRPDAVRKWFATR